MRRVCLSALVIWSLGGAAGADDPTSFRPATKNLRQGIFVVGWSGPQGSNFGTAWVISKKHRLLATNAHVADIFSRMPPGRVKAVVNEGTQSYTVTKAWYHPGVRRFLSSGANMSVRSGDSKLDVDANSPDVAVLQLAMDGPDLPVELPLASPKIFFDLQSLPAAILGFPGHDTLTFPRPGEKAQATFHEGVISRITDFGNLSAASDATAQRLQYTMETWGGFSGSPIYLRSGEVIGLHNSGRYIDPTRKQTTRMIAQGIRVDCLYELLVHHGLDAKVPISMAPKELLVKRWLAPDPNLAVYTKLQKIVDEANDLVYNRLDFQAGIDKCTQAIKMHRNFAPAYATRSDGYNNWYFHHGSSLSAERRLELLKLAYSDAAANADLLGQTTPESAFDAIVQRLIILNNLGQLTRDRKFNQEALQGAEQLLAQKYLAGWQRGSASSTKAVALSNLGKSEEARRWHVLR
jgi:hypothetical protein